MLAKLFSIQANRLIKIKIYDSLLRHYPLKASPISISADTQTTANHHQNFLKKAPSSQARNTKFIIYSFTVHFLFNLRAIL
ncbi:hypothetical protein CBW58_14155 [Yersinia frederiksenii]|nr:hypothetical protein CBW58_14155 [Yersinia frederiksenii]